MTTARPNIAPAKSIKIAANLHRELLIAKAYRGEDIQDILEAAWETFKREQGDRLHEPVQEQVETAA
jgi:hypothetical protein